MVTQETIAPSGAANYFTLGLVEIIGPDEFEKIARYFSNLKLFQNNITVAQVLPLRQKLDEIYGVTGARGIVMCSGRAAFKHLLKQQSKQLGFENESFRFLPGRLKLKRGLSLLADWMEKNYQEKIVVENQEKNWLFKVVDCCECVDSKSIDSMCDFTAGCLQEFMSWASGGKFYRIKEISCQGMGDESCVFAIDKAPVE